MNVVVLVGRLGADPDFKQLDSGKELCKLRVATESSYTKRDGHRDTSWHDVVVWGKQAKACSDYLSKGQQVSLQGSIRYRTWEDKDNNKRISTEIVASQVSFGPGGSKKEEPKKSEKITEDVPW